MNFDFKNGRKINLMKITKNHAADPEIGFFKKSISKPNGCATAIPTVWELVNLRRLKIFKKSSITTSIKYFSKFIKYCF